MLTIVLFYALFLFNFCGHAVNARHQGSLGYHNDAALAKVTGHDEVNDYYVPSSRRHSRLSRRTRIASNHPNTRDVNLARLQWLVTRFPSPDLPLHGQVNFDHHLHISKRNGKQPAKKPSSSSPPSSSSSSSSRRPQRNTNASRPPVPSGKQRHPPAGPSPPKGPSLGSFVTPSFQHMIPPSRPKPQTEFKNWYPPAGTPPHMGLPFHGGQHGSTNNQGLRGGSNAGPHGANVYRYNPYPAHQAPPPH